MRLCTINIERLVFNVLEDAAARWPIAPDTQVHGEYWLHGTYYLALVPSTASVKLAFDHSCENPEVLGQNFEIGGATLASSHNLLKLCVSLAQAIWATIIIYRS